MYYAGTYPKHEKKLVITDDINLFPSDIGKIEVFELFEDIPLQDYEEYHLIGIEPEILQEELDNRRMLTEYLRTHPWRLKVYKRIHL